MNDSRNDGGFLAIFANSKGDQTAEPRKGNVLNEDVFDGEHSVGVHLRVFMSGTDQKVGLREDVEEVHAHEKDVKGDETSGEDEAGVGRHLLLALLFVGFAGHDRSVGEYSVVLE